ncbi:tumor protein p73 isoform X2 [Phlebotomus papatasi]|nr:tumor protein p73 isoform X2 [Phlebotomus papatasi]XP_055698074.1 tumor protein p73 isoform X2 [Phlebotomus papatasi]XP_055698075.1 tumor protein p73 isoform X2 [Phlebotomus papatasi]
MVDNTMNHFEEQPNNLFQINTEELLMATEMGSQEAYNAIQGIFDLGNSQNVNQLMLPQDTSMLRDQKPDPEHWNHFPRLVENSGTCDFELTIPAPSNQSNWSYSPSLKKLFIKINTLLNLEVSYKTSFATRLFCRVMIVYPDYPYMPVVRCNNHKVINPEKPGRESHIIKCPHEGVEYWGTKDGQTFIKRLALIYPLTQNIKTEEDNWVRTSVTLEFACQNSCPTGINRRATVLFFTLEDERGQIYGQRMINFKVCTVPKRDRSHEESHPDKKRKSSSSGSCSSGKRPCRAPEVVPVNEAMIKYNEEEDTPSVQCEKVSSAESLVNGISCKITMPDAASMKNVLHSAYNEIAGKIVSDPENSQRFGKFIKMIKKQQQSLPSQSNLNN